MNPTIDALIKNIQLFELFAQVYLFGSVAQNKEFPNDIDLLLVYDKYSSKIQSEKDYIYSFLKKILNLHVDLVVLSENELLETKILQKICVYERLK
ncbi:nucleotidyltransferase domain-containing protein [Aliarcobacter butzleri]|uniref:nucleotidyltransferase domain-containing protein n=1 Tax=Aliarcobacter butzleri TaxID=28197 RepID=UPI001868A2DA|nr:nucleotidyltransferase domain-containing protein [Aliarcobacter butzleri]